MLYNNSQFCLVADGILTMSDVRLTNRANNTGDLALVADSYGFVDLETEDGLETAVYISLFSDARAGNDDILPNPDSNAGGWWGDALENFSLGSKLWLLARSKTSPEVTKKARFYCYEALKWLIEEGVAQTINITVTRSGLTALIYEIEIIKPTEKQNSKFKWSANWSGQVARVYS